jgi:hypothetical protein
MPPGLRRLLSLNALSAQAPALLPMRGSSQSHPIVLGQSRRILTLLFTSRLPSQLPPMRPQQLIPSIGRRCTRLPVVLTPQRRNNSYTVSVDEPSDARPADSPPPRARSAPTPVPDEPTVEEPSLGKSDILLGTEEQVCGGTLFITLTVPGFGHARVDFCGWTWSERSNGERTTNPPDELVPGNQRCTGVGIDAEQS